MKKETAQLPPLLLDWRKQHPEDLSTPLSFYEPQKCDISRHAKDPILGRLSRTVRPGEVGRTCFEFKATVFNLRGVLPSKKQASKDQRWEEVKSGGEEGVVVSPKGRRRQN